MFKRSISLLLLGFITLIQAQYTDVINSNYPGFSESPYSVGPGVYQFESNFFYKKAKPIVMFDNPESYGVNIHFRTSFFLERLEINLKTALQNDKHTFTNVFESSTNQFGLGEFNFGAKYLLYVPTYEDKTKQVRSWKHRHGFDWKRWIPHAAIYAGANVGSFLNTYHNKGAITPKVGILLQNEFSLQYNFITNVYYNHIGTKNAEWSYITTGTYIFNKRWSGFLEHQAKFNKIENTGNIGGGFAYLFNRHLQINSSARITFQESGPGFYGSVGLSYRIDRHIDTFTELDDFGNKIEDEKKKSYSKGFFGRMFDGIKGLFKKKDKFEYKGKNKEGKTETKEVKVENQSRKRKKSVLGGIIKNDKKDKKKKTKAELKSERKAEKAAEKEKRREDKDRLKAEKKAQKELEKKAKEDAEEELRLEKEKQELLEEDEEFKKEEEKLNNEIKELEKDLDKGENDKKDEEKDED